MTYIMDNTPIIVTEQMSDIFTKYHLKGLPLDAVIHRFSAPDNGCPHDHPFGFRSIIMHGGYIEEVFNLETGKSIIMHRKVGDIIDNLASTVHRINELPNGECWTLIFPQSKERDSGFYDFRDDGVYHRFWYESEFKPFILPKP